jgi:pyruvate/2-oxoacid:ferredoxin oxidoreductase alpha subunit
MVVPGFRHHRHHHRKQTGAGSRMTVQLVPLYGNQACALAAVAAGCRFFAGYPITPSSEIAEHMSHELPKVDGVFIQMEDEIASLAAVIGASMGGAKAMTATSGPGFSLMQENLGYAAMTEVPCVIIDVMRGGPSTGMPTRPAQGDLMQARWGTHGDHPVVALVPASVQEIYSETIRAFNLAEQYRVPVVVLYDQIVAHLLESIEIPDAKDVTRLDRKWAGEGGTGFAPYAETADHRPDAFGRGLSDAEARHRRPRRHPHSRKDREAPRRDRKIRDAARRGRRHSHHRRRHHRARGAARRADAAPAGRQGRPVATDHALAVPGTGGARGRGQGTPRRRSRTQHRPARARGRAHHRRPRPRDEPGPRRRRADHAGRDRQADRGDRAMPSGAIGVNHRRSPLPKTPS